MQDTEVVLGVLRERGRKGLPCTQLYRQMFNRKLFLTAYGSIYPNQGAMTPGPGQETADGMSEEKIDHIIGLLRCEEVPVRAGSPRVHPEEEREDATPGAAVVVGQAGRRGSPPPAGGDLRAVLF